MHLRNSKRGLEEEMDATDKERGFWKSKLMHLRKKERGTL